MTSSLQYEPLAIQRERWPQQGKHVMAHFDDERVVVYQAYAPHIAESAVAHQRFGDGFSMTRMTWIKPGFLWMMFRSGWGTKENQERVLAISLRRAAFDRYLSMAVHSSYQPRYGDRTQWRQLLKRSDVRLQWDPDHGPGGEKRQRRAIQLGLRGAAVQAYVDRDTLAIEDITPFVHAQARHKTDASALLVPVERVYPANPADLADLADVARRAATP